MLCLVFACLVYVAATEETDEFTNFKTIISQEYERRIGKGDQVLGRLVEDPCRGRSAAMGRMPTSGYKAMLNMVDAANILERSSGVVTEKAESMLLLCKEVLQKSKNRAMNTKVCGEALAHYRVRSKSLPGRASRGSAWDQLFGDLREVMDTNDILEGLDIWSSATLGLLIDNTGSMADDIGQITKIAENFLRTKLYDEGLIYNFVIMSFGDPDYTEPTSYEEPSQALKHLNTKIVASMGGDCPEMTCQALEEMVLYTEVSKDSPIFVFTDASSKDCDERTVTDLEIFAQGFAETIHFVLTGTCGEEVDGNFTRLAGSTGGNIYQVSDEDIYRLTDIIEESAGTSSYISWEPYDSADTWGWDSGDWDFRKKRDVGEEGPMRVLKRGTRQAGVHQIPFYVDETVGRLIMQVTFDSRINSPVDRTLLESVTFSIRVDCDSYVQSSKFGNIAHFAVDCPCVGEWVMTIPFLATNKYSYSARTFGEFTIGFDVIFEQENGSGMLRRRRDPCAGEATTIFVTLFQEESIDTEQKVSLFVTGNRYEHGYKLTKDRSSGQWTTRIFIPKIPFTVQVRGRTVAGNTFLRILNTPTRPTTTCLMTEHIYPSPLVIKPGGYSVIIMSLKNKFEPKSYYLYCYTNRRADGFTTRILRPSNRFHEVRDTDRYYYLYVRVTAPPVIAVGEVVTVTCRVSSDHKDDTASQNVELIVASIYA